MVIAVAEYERLCQAEQAASPNSVKNRPPAPPSDSQVFPAPPVRPENKTGAPDFIDYLLAIPKGGPDDLFERIPVEPRDVEF